MDCGSGAAERAQDRASGGGVGTSGTGSGGARRSCRSTSSRGAGARSICAMGGVDDESAGARQAFSPVDAHVVTVRCFDDNCCPCVQTGQEQFASPSR